MSALPGTVPHRRSGRRVEAAVPLDISGAGRATAEAVRFLRECQSLGLRVRWRAAGTPSYDPLVLRHLPPPAELPGDPATLAAWRAEHTHGALHHRRGPDFVTVLDRRQRGTAVRLTLDHPGLLGTFLRLLEPTPVAALDPVEREALTLLAAERLVLAGGGWAVTLPPRLRQWPVPCTAI
ncbi:MULTISPECIES: DUF5825 family protein [Streptomyces]|uniref:DUF5825 family protein n=2 Tax=Streptomyces TaxID=1883 RepID=A0ABS9J876_9ACTN|nr:MULTISPECIES: DUF5825 family protein [Streptomyces]MYU30733.1 hypothetical protein [Streptomyces sp. SID7810]CUW31816.1 hypothetical protein TUE45_06565 [Streptomyces reticuli]AKN71951.1 hypothetical protein QR97_21100 [Streptomyces sp. PBH53]MCG0061767.1 DUF5825 family protein [Streptomyces tricolor]OYP14748.1 hypothetical protein CFC35_09605 [Streptomyces sp. FBKL.4005]